MNRSRKSRSSSYNVDRHIINSNKFTGSTTTVVAQDLSSRPQNFNVVQRPPKNLNNQIHWVQLSVNTQLSCSSTGIVETNFAFSGGTFPEFSDYTACFDQYCLYSICCTFANIANTQNQQSVRIGTALDYDSVSNLGSLSLLQGYTTYEEAILGVGGSSSLVRYLKPALAPQLTSVAGIPVAGGVARMWCDSAYPSIQQYGLRTMTLPWVATANGVVEVNFTATIGFRSGI
jgi:hypothetical protein